MIEIIHNFSLKFSKEASIDYLLKFLIVNLVDISEMFHVYLIVENIYHKAK